MSVLWVRLVLLLPCFFIIAAGQEHEDQLLLLQSHGGVDEILLVDLQDNSSHRVVRSNRDIVAFDYHLARNMIFWATSTKIFRSVLRATESSKAALESLVEVGRVGGLAVDWIHDRLYWTDVVAAQLEVSRLNGGARQVIYRDGWPSTLIVDPLLGKVFWLDNNPSQGKLRYARLDGSYPRRGGAWQSAPVLWQAGLLGPRSQLSLDTPAGQLYFTQLEGGGGTVMSIDYRLKRIRVVVRCWGLGPGLAVSHGRLFLTNSSAVCWNREGRYRNNFTTDFFKHTKQMKVVSALLQPSAPDQCESFRSRCAHECFVVDDYPSCSCFFGFQLQPDNATCSEQGYVVLSSASSLYRTTLPSPASVDPYPQTQLLFKSPRADVAALDVHVRRNLVFWTNNKDTIYKVSVDKQTEPAVVVNGTAKDVAVDWLHDHLYWTDDSRVLLGSLDGDLQVVVAEDPDKPFSVAVDPVNRVLFWSTCGWSNTIVKASLSGSNRTKLVSSNISCAASLSVDASRRRLYWVDRTHGTTSSIYYDGQIRHTVHDPRVREVAVQGDRLLWTSAGDPWLHLNQSSWAKEIYLGFEPRGVAVFSSDSQPDGSNYCRGSLCGGLCVSGQQPHLTTCLCPLGQLLADDNSTCLSPQPMALTGSPLEVIDYNSTSFTLFCDHFFEAERYDVTLELLSSFQTGNIEFERIKLVAETLPTSVTGLAAAATYSVTVEPHPTYLGVLRTEVSTPPPPQQVSRLPLVYKPWDSAPLAWLDADQINDTDTNTWQPLVSEFFLLMFPLSEQPRQSGGGGVGDTVVQPPHLLERISRRLDEMGITDKFVVAKHYKNKMEFDQDPEIHLTNTPFDMEFFLAMIQVSNYNGGYGVDVALSERARIPWPR